MGGTLIKITTSEGVIEVELEDEKAPETVKNFLQYADSYFYNGLIFHRVIKNFMIQTGGITFDYQRKETNDPIINESHNGLLNNKGTLAMARHNHPDSATSQFFINLRDNPHLNFKPGKPGYTVFGKVVKGMDIVKKIGRAPVKRYARFQNLPRKAIYIERVERITSSAKSKSQAESNQGK